MKLCVIPARGGSKRIPGKNIREFGGRPMIAWSIEAALQSECFDHVIVSTDDDRIADIAVRYGATVPFRRPVELADDHTATRPVINHSIREMQNLHGPVNYVCCIYPTAPFLEAEDLRIAHDLLIGGDANFVFSCTTFAYPIYRAFKLNKKNEPERIWPKHRFSRSQDLEVAYHDAGQFYWGKSKSFLEDIDTISSRSQPYIMPRYRVHDIDTEEDWRQAELMHWALRRAK
jgi:pseudaminic acid cytidylyltransferase